MKRAFDIASSLILLIVLSLPLLVLTVIQLACLGSPLFFRQERAGSLGKRFEIIKFRTMREGDETDEARLTSWGNSYAAPVSMNCPNSSMYSAVR